MRSTISARFFFITLFLALTPCPLFAQTETVPGRSAGPPVRTPVQRNTAERIDRTRQQARRSALIAGSERTENDLFVQGREEQEKLLDKVRDAVLWFHELDTDANKRNTRPDQYRQHVEPMELLQAAILMRKAKKDTMVFTLLSIFPYLQATPEECFEIEERLGDEGLDTLGNLVDDTGAPLGDGEPVAVRTVRQRAREFLLRELQPAERMVLYDDPKTPYDFARAAGLLAGVGRSSLVRSFLKEFNKQPQPGPEECARLVDEIGSKTLMRIALERIYAPQGEKAVRTIFEGARKYWNEPEAIQKAIDRLAAGEKSTAAADITTVWRGAEVSVALLIDRFAEADDEEEAKELRAVLASMGSPVKEALAEGLRCGKAEVVRQCAKTLAVMLAPQESPVLFGPLYGKTGEFADIPDDVREDIRAIVEKLLDAVPSREEAARQLCKFANDYAERRRTIRADVQGMSEIWVLNESSGSVERRQMPVAAAYRLYAYRYARAADAVVPDWPSVTRLYMEMLFERSAYLDGERKVDEADISALRNLLDEREVSVATVESLLDEAMQNRRFGTATIAATLLADRGTAETLCYAGANEVSRGSAGIRPRALVRACTSPDRRLRFAALSAVMKLDPQRPYPGASFVAETLAWFARSEGINRAVVASPKQTDAMKLAGFLHPLGFRTDTALSGGEAMRLAAATPDVELLLLDIRCRKPLPSMLAKEIRNDNRMHDIPVAILFTAAYPAAGPVPVDLLVEPYDRQTQTDRLSPDNVFAHALSMTYPMPVDARGAKWMLDDLYLKTAVNPVDPETRLLQGRQALNWIREAVERSLDPEQVTVYTFEDLDRIAVDATRSGTLFYQGIELAATIPSAGMQALLAEATAHPSLEIETRRFVAERFISSVEKHGVLLRGKQVQVLYDRYNASEFEPKEVQELLGSLLDAVEDAVLGKGEGS